MAIELEDQTIFRPIELFRSDLYIFQLPLLLEFLGSGFQRVDPGEGVGRRVVPFE